MKEKVKKKIAEAFSNMDFSNYSQVLDAAKELEGVDPKKVIEWISGMLDAEWHWSEIINYGGVQNIEKAFDTEFDIATLINAYFGDDDHWYFESSYFENTGRNPGSQWIDEFNELTNKGITANDVIENLSLDFLIESRSYGPGLCVFFDFIERNSGDFKLFIRRLAPEVNRLSHEDVEDVIYCLDDHLEDGDLDMNKLFQRIEWASVYEDEVPDYVEFFMKHAPELVKKIPLTPSV